jgi:D-alanine-D-alanine ligase
VLVLFGGRSSEHSISCLSASNVTAALRSAGFQVIPVGISRAGAWIFDPAIGDEALPEIPATGQLVDLRFHPPGLVIDGKFQGFDVVFPVLHGPWGEDGTVQGVFETMQVPAVGSGVLASAIVMDKPTMKTLLVDAGLHVAAWRVDDRQDLQYPVFVKPARAGSSLGISRAGNDAEYHEAIERARMYDPRLIIEQAIDGVREIECGVVGNRASRCGEVRVTRGFYDFDAKYAVDGAELIVPADLPAELESRIQQLAHRAYRALGCEGLARVDFFLSSDGEVFVNEVNTMPGFTMSSLFPRMWEATGVDYQELVTSLVNDALYRGSGLRNPDPTLQQG